MKTFSSCILLLISFFFSSSQNKNFIDQPYIEVNGNADSMVIPNEIFIRIIITERDTRDKISVEELEAKMISALSNIGVNIEKDLETNDMSSNFRTYLLKGKDILKTKQYLLKVKDASTTAKIFVRLEELGISNLSIERVDHSDLENIRNVLRTKAVENARARAVALTQPLKQTVSYAVHIIDNENYNTNNTLQGRIAGLQIRGYELSQDKKDVKIEFEKIKVGANISVKFILK